MNQDATTSSPAQKTLKNNNAARRRWIMLFVLLVVTVGGVLAYWRYAAIYPSTDNAYTGADIVRIAPLVSGPVTNVYVAEDEKVSKDDPLFDIDPAPYEAALRGARAQFDAAVNATGTAGEDLKSAADEMEAKRVALVAALDKYREAEGAQGEGEAPNQATLDALEDVHAAHAAYEEAHEAFSKAQDQDLVVTTPTVKLRGAAAQLDKATEDRVKTHVLSPGDGWVSNVRLRPGAVVATGTPAFALGAVESISPGSGALFSVLPPENATGNWVKVTQRFPVRVKITSEADADRPLRVGASATVTVDTTKDSTEGTQ